MSSSAEESLDVKNLLVKIREIEKDLVTINITQTELENVIENIDALRNQLNNLQINATSSNLDNETNNKNSLNRDDIMRYSRQLILPNFGIQAQLKLKNSSFLIVGCGGLGCPAAQYLSAAGCGKIGLVDYDEVELSNLHRQTLHTESRIGTSKAKSVRQALLENNKHCSIDIFHLALDSTNALDIIKDYDVILDCTDNVATRYLLNDACVLLNKPLVSGSALQFDGQLTVYHYGDMGPCYRCLFPVPPPPEMVTNCSDGGVLGAITGIIGSLQALEAMKVVTGVGDILAARMLIFDGTTTKFRNIKLRSKRLDCAICSDSPIITRLINYEEFCGMRACDKNVSLSVLTQDERINVHDYKQLQNKEHLLIDVRPPAEFEICHLPNSKNMPLKQILDDNYIDEFKEQLNDEDYQIIVLCRRGNDSQIAVQHMKTKYPQNTIHDIEGGLYAWHFQIDKKFPIY